jgi:hypothetical protein
MESLLLANTVAASTSAVPPAGPASVRSAETRPLGDAPRSVSTGNISTQDDVTSSEEDVAQAQLTTDSTGQLRFIGNTSTVSILGELDDRYDREKQPQGPKNAGSSNKSTVEMPFLTNSLGLDITGAVPKADGVRRSSR